MNRSSGQPSVSMIWCAREGEGGRRLAPANEDHAPVLRDLAERLPHDVVKRGVPRHLLVVVEHRREGRLEPAVEFAEKAPGDVAMSASPSSAWYQSTRCLRPAR